MRAYGKCVPNGVWAVCVCAAIRLTASAGDLQLEYNRDVRPILADNCFACHGPDSAARQADLRLDRRATAVDMGAIVPGEPEESELLRRIRSEDSAERMPPPETKKQLTIQQQQTLEQWIASGAEYQPHWSLITPVRPDLPDVGKADWARNALDQFILARLEAAGLTPAPPADPWTVVRRVSLDLTGLPPDPDLVEQFTADALRESGLARPPVQPGSPSEAYRFDKAYEALVDKLLQSLQWGEHRGRYWLDVARYADTHGIHFDNYREVWAYRDWVINAFNRNLPFDQFTIEQLAGDLLPNATLDQQIASGFNRCNITTNEGGAISEEYLVLYTRDRTETVGQVWLGTTVGCAVCHDHKFDPLSQKEFYELAAFFNNTAQGAMDGNIKDTPPILPVPTAVERTAWEALKSDIAQAQQAVESRREAARPDFEEWLAAINDTISDTISTTSGAVAGSQEEVAQAGAVAKREDLLRVPTEGLHLHAPLSEGEGRRAQLTIERIPRDVVLADSATWQPGPSGGSALGPQGAACELPDVGDFDRDQAFTCAAWVKLPASDSFGAIAARMDDGNGFRGWDFWSQRRQIGMHVVHRWPENALKVVAKNQVPANEWTHVAVSYDGTGKASGLKVYYNGEEQPTNVESDTLVDTTRTSVPFKIGQRNQDQPLSGAAIQDLRIYTRALAPAEMTALARLSQLAGILAKAPDQRTQPEKDQLYGWWLGAHDEPFQSQAAELARLEKEQAEIKARGTIAHVMREKEEPAMAYVLFRGEYDQRRDEVKPGTPAALPPMPADLSRDRLGFAQWLLLPENPLPARVTVNRFWQQLFGTGLVRTAGDFGVAGELSSHPELLDWLAVEFRESGWDVKRLFKLLVMSATYRQAAIATTEKLEKDPDNRLLSRGPRFRMDAEMVRDYAIAASGLLVPEIGGRSVKPYQPPGVWEAVAMIGSNTRDYRPDSGESLYRRSMYTFWKRSAPPASLDIFNAPSREVCTVRRERTNTPLQALVTLNDPQFVEAARILAGQALVRAGDDVQQKADFITMRLLARPLLPPERPLVASSLADLLAHYQARPEDADQLLAVGEAPRDTSLDAATHAAWTMLTNELMNLDEVLNK